MSAIIKHALLILLSVAGIHPVLAERTTTFFHTDALGSVVAATNEQGALLWRKDYAPYGEQIDATSDGEALSYTGKQHDEITGLTYFGARYYDADIARFLSIDPVGVDPARLFSFNRYAYANDNPYRYVDPDGREPGERIAGFALGLVYTKEQAALVQRVYVAGGTREAAYAIDTGQAVADASRALARGESVDVALTTATVALLGAVAKRKGGGPPQSRSAAFRRAKELGGVPRSAQPTSTRTERLRDQPGNVQSRVHEYVRPDGSTTTIREHSRGHEQGNIGPHFNVEVRPPGGGPRQSLSGGADDHVFFDGS